MAECNHDCGSCAQMGNCSVQDLREQPNKKSTIRKVIGVVSGKGGVGKSSVTSLLAVQLQRKGYHVGILDADITGPSIPKMFNLHTLLSGNEDGVFPVKTETGIQVVSANLLTHDEKTPVVWRGPLVAGMVKKFWTDVIWEDIDFLLVDMPPGTGDVPLTVFQSVAVDGIIMVTSPQDLVSLIVSKAVNMADMMKIPVLGLVENYSYAICPHCGEKIRIFGESHTAEVGREFNVKLLAEMPMDSNLAALSDKGEIEKAEVNYLDKVVDMLEGLESK